MRNLTDLDEEELIFYSKLIVSISTMLSTDKDLARGFVMQPKTECRTVEFVVEVTGDMELYLCLINFDRDTEIFSVSGIDFPKGLFNDLIHYV